MTFIFAQRENGSDSIGYWVTCLFSVLGLSLNILTRHEADTTQA